MSQSNGNVTVQSGPGLPVLVFLVFLTLKLTGVIAWSWWWVTAPLWIPFAIGVVIFLIVAVVLLTKRNNLSKNYNSARGRLPR